MYEALGNIYSNSLVWYIITNAIPVISLSLIEVPLEEFSINRQTHNTPLIMGKGATHNLIMILAALEELPFRM